MQKCVIFQIIHFSFPSVSRSFFSISHFAPIIPLSAFRILPYRPALMRHISPSSALPSISSLFTSLSPRSACSPILALAAPCHRWPECCGTQCFSSIFLFPPKGIPFRWRGCYFLIVIEWFPWDTEWLLFFPSTISGSNFWATPLSPAAAPRLWIAILSAASLSGWPTSSGSRSCPRIPSACWLSLSRSWRGCFRWISGSTNEGGSSRASIFRVSS